MIEVQLKIALRYEGCPVCRLCQQSEARRLFFILWEGVMDREFRRVFLASEGLCLEHAWRLQTLEASEWHSGLGTGTLYESLLEAVRRMLAEQSEQTAPAASPWWHPARWLRRAPAPALPPPEQCPVCRSRQRSEQSYTSTLAKLLEQPAWREAYRASDGLCLPHLRQTLPHTARETRQWLLAETETKLHIVHHDLKEYLRKHSWQYHAEPMSQAEQRSWIRAVAVLRGERPHTREERFEQ
ncbi:MAG TPA: hypothetical protein DEP84_34055, partial [Chloroflexi bacterium]|nr:hypothetical protein [Chloroflexota bacterium]